MTMEEVINLVCDQVAKNVVAKIEVKLTYQNGKTIHITSGDEAQYQAARNEQVMGTNIAVDSRQKSRTPIVCHNCHESGHMQRECTKPRIGNNTPITGNRFANTSGGGQQVGNNSVNKGGFGDGTGFGGNGFSGNSANYSVSQNNSGFGNGPGFGGNGGNKPQQVGNNNAGSENVRESVTGQPWGANDGWNTPAKQNNNGLDAGLNSQVQPTSSGQHELATAVANAGAFTGNYRK